MVLNACNSQAQATEIHQHVDCVISMNQSINDHAAIEFSNGFYTALCAEKSYDIAYEIGHNAIAFENREQTSVPELMLRNSVASKSGLCSKRLSGATNLEDPNGSVPLLSEFYVDRPPVETDCYRALDRPGALIRLNAARQMGKSSLMSRVLYAWKKRRLPLRINKLSASRS